MGFKGEKVGRFVLDRKIGTALEGEIWKARGEGGGESAGAAAAIKLFYDNEWAAAYRASGIPKTVEHVNVARVLEGGTDGMTPWLARELVEGTSLRALVAAEKYLPLAGAIPAAIQMVRGLAALHKVGIAHLDLRPGNVLLDAAGNLKIADVTTEGYRRAVLARLGDKLKPLPKERAEAFNAYLPPEQKKGDISGMTGDMYQLGVIFYEMLTGERPQGFDVRLPSQRDKRIPKVFDEIIMRSLERTPRARLPSAVALEPQLIEGITKVGFHLDMKLEPAAWVKATPWRDAGSPLGEKTGKFKLTFDELANPKD